MSTRTVRTLGPVSEHPAHDGETGAQALHRLAARAHESGARLVVEENNAHFVTSVSRPGLRHAVTLLSCDCEGFLRWGRCLHYALVLEAYHSLPPIEPPVGPGPDGGGAALAAPKTGHGDRFEAVDVVLSVVPVARPVAETNRAAMARYLEGDRDRDARWELTSALLGEAYFQACGLADRATETWCRERLGLPSTERVCPSALCGGRGTVQSHPEDRVERCDVCRGAGVVPGHSVAVAAFAGQAVRHAA